MECCDNLVQAVNDGIITQGKKGLISDGRILNDVFSDYYIRSIRGPSDCNYYAINYCPFCGRAISSYVQGG